MRHLRLIHTSEPAERLSLGYHPDYGLPDDYRLRVLDEAALFGIPTTAARHRLSEGCIYKWRRAARSMRETREASPAPCGKRGSTS